MLRRKIKIFTFIIVMMHMVSIQTGYGGQSHAAFDKKRLHEELMALPAEQRPARIQQLKEEHLKRRQEHAVKLEQKWQNATSEERQYFCQKLQHKCNAENKKFVCELARNKCSK
jgi:hypothetical protein